MPSRSGEYCYPCGRSFCHRKALESHWKYSQKHVWDQRCERVFNSADEYYEHQRGSTSHWVCYECDVDYEFQEGLDYHHEESDRHHPCEQCGRDFGSENALEYHLLTHRERDIPCDYCGDNRKFATESAKIIHLENGCSVGKVRLYQIVAEGYYGSEHVNDSWIGILEDGQFGKLRPRYSTAPPFFCTHCECGFSTLSGLVQHVESPRCSQNTEYGSIAKMLQEIRDALDAW